MSKLERKLQDLLKDGYETVSIHDVLAWMRQIKQEAFAKRHHLNG